MIFNTGGILAGGGGGHASLEPPTFITVLHTLLPDNHLVHALVKYENVLFAAVAGLILSAIFLLGTRKLTIVPGKFQNFLEVVVEGLQNFFGDILGRHGKTFVPFIGTLFLYIWCMNMMGMVPFLKSSTADLNTTLALAICVFVVVQSTAFIKLGPKNYLDHLAGQPREPIMFFLAPVLFVLFFLLDVMIPPMTLALRLFGNITGEDTLLGAFLDLGTNQLFHPAGILSFLGGMIAFFATVIFRFLSLLLGSIQALVFSLLTTIYILMVLPHEEHSH